MMKTVPMVSHSQIFLMPQTVPCPRCQIGVTVLELVHRSPDGTVTCSRGHAFPVQHVAQYFGRIDNIGTPEDVEEKVKGWMAAQAAPKTPVYRVTPWWLILAAGIGGILFGVGLGLAVVSYALRGAPLPH